MATKRQFIFRACMLTLVAFFSLCVLFLIMVWPYPSICTITLTNTTARAVTDIRIKVSESEAAFATLAPYAATTHVFSITSDTGYHIGYTLDGFSAASTNVGYSTLGADNASRINILNDGTLSHVWQHVPHGIDVKMRALKTWEQIRLTHR